MVLKNNIICLILTISLWIVFLLFIFPNYRFIYARRLQPPSNTSLLPCRVIREPPALSSLCSTWQGYFSFYTAVYVISSLQAPRLPGCMIAAHVVTYQVGVIAGVRGSDVSNRHELRRSRLARAAQALDSGRPSLLRAPLLLPISSAMMPVCCEGIAVASKVAGSSLIRLLSKHRWTCAHAEKTKNPRFAP